MRKKFHCQRRHAKQRARDRFNIKFDTKMRKRLITEIQAPKSRYVEFFEKQSHRVSIWKILWEGEEVAIVYDRMRKEIVTFMPFAWVDGREYEEALDEA